MIRNYKLFINGVWRAGGEGTDLPLINPANERVIGRVAIATPADLDDTLVSANNGLEAWAKTPARERGKLLIEAARILEGKTDTAARALSDEQGKTVDEARAEYARAVETLKWNGGQAEALSAPIPMNNDRALAPEPIGIVAAFTPWNYPAVLNARKLAAPLAAGCPVILKAAEETPSAGVAIVEALVEAGMPVGVVNLVFGQPAQISSHLLGSPLVKVLTFTGSTAVGKRLTALAAAHLQRCILELGGHSPVIIFADADIDAAISAISDYKFECAGQSCNAPSRVIVEHTIYPKVVEGLVGRAAAIKVGNGDDPKTQMGPMANIRRIEAMTKLIWDAVERGARIETGGSRLDREGFFWPPTILTNVAPESAVLREEPFGPILTVAPFSTLNDAIEQANSTRYGLASYFFTAADDIKTTLVRCLAAGSVSINRLKGVSADAPNAGINDSGYGYEGGVEGFRAFQNLKLVNGAEVLLRGTSTRF